MLLLIYTKYVGDNLKKIIIIAVLVVFFISSANLIFAYDGSHVVNVAGLDFNIPNGYHKDTELSMSEDGPVTDYKFNQKNSHIEGVEYTNGTSFISITTATSYGEPFVLEDGTSASGKQTNISGKMGSLTDTDLECTFFYVENGIRVMINADNVTEIEKCINTTN